MLMESADLPTRDLSLISSTTASLMGPSAKRPAHQQPLTGFPCCTGRSAARPPEALRKLTSV